MKVMLDTNILLDLTLKRENFNKVKRVLSTTGYEYCVCSLTLKDVFYITNSVMEFPKSDMKKMSDLLTILTVNREVVEHAYNSKMADLEDAIQEQCAKRSNVDVIITSDKKLIKQSMLKAMTLDDFIEMHM